MARKYEKTTGYWVYAHITPNGLYYVGMTKLQPCRRWKPSNYKTHSLKPYIKQYGWENIQHKVLIDGLTKKDAEQWEDRIIQALSMNGLCINKQRSGGCTRDDRQAYEKQWYEEHKEERKAQMRQWYKDHKDDIKAHKNQYNKQWRSTSEGKIYSRVSAYIRYHPDKVIETPMEAKQKYLATGYIPTYIKTDDLI